MITGLCLLMLGADPAGAKFPAPDLVLLHTQPGAYVRVQQPVGETEPDERSLRVPLPLDLRWETLDIILLDAEGKPLAQDSPRPWGIQRPIDWGAPGWREWSLRNENALVRIQVRGERLAGRVVPVPPVPNKEMFAIRTTDALATDHTLHLVDARDIESISQSSAVATIPLAEDVPPPRVVAWTGLVEGSDWQPTYRLTLLPEGQADLRLLAAIRVTALLLRAKETLLAVGSPPSLDEQRFPWANDPSRYAVPSPLEARETVVEVARVVGECETRGDWQVAQADAADTVHEFLRIVNRTDKSWPAGEVLVLDGVRPIHRGRFPYTPPAAVAEIDLGPAFGIHVRREETEIERKQVRNDANSPFRIRIVGSLFVESTRKEAVQLRVRKEFEGESLSASDDAQQMRLPNQVGKAQAATRIEWNVELEPGESKRLTYGYWLETAIRP